VGEPFLSRPWLEAALAQALAPEGGTAAPPRVRIVRSERCWALVEVEHAWLMEARRAWNGTILGPSGRHAVVATHRTWGTLKDGKAWLRNRPVHPPSESPAPHPVH
jgi:hypothetical protein